MQKRMLMAFATIAVFMVLWTQLGNMMGYTPKKPKPKQTEAVENTRSGEESPETEPEVKETAAVAADSESEPEATDEAPVVEQRTDVLENDKITLTFNNAGGTIRHARLKEYFKTTAHQDPVDLIFAHVHKPGELEWRGGNDRDVVYQVELGANQITYTGKVGNVSIEKTFRLEKDYLLRCETKVTGVEDDFLMVIAEGLEPIEPGESLEQSFWSMGAINPKMMYFTWSEEGSQEYKLVKMGDRRNFQPLLEETQRVDWGGVRDNYFANVFMPDQPVDNVYHKITDVFLGSEGKPVKLPVVALAGKEQLTGSFFMGPMSDEILAATDPRLDDLITYGYTGLLSKWLLVGLQFFHDITNNWGWAIILLTIVIRSAMVPLMIPSVKSSFKMRKIQPKIEKLRAKYTGSDLESKQKLSQETFELYRKEGVNPFSSCFTAIAQMPVFFAYFSLLRTSFTLRQADWIMWVQDLSLKDGTFILPVLMGVTMFLSTMAMPMPATDPAQQKMMKIMPLMVSVFFIFMPSGLVLYMITSNLFTMTQTRLLKWRFDKE